MKEPLVSMSVLLATSALFTSQRRAAAGDTPPVNSKLIAGYALCPEDQLNVRVLDLDEFNAPNLSPFRIDLRGNIRLPLVGRFHAAGLTVEQLEAEIAGRLSHVVKDERADTIVSPVRNDSAGLLYRRDQRGVSLAVNALCNAGSEASRE